MKKVVAWILVLALWCVCPVSNAATNQSAFLSNDSIVTDVKHLGALDIEFNIHGSSKEPVSYEIYLYRGSKPDDRTFIGRPIRSGTVDTTTTVQIKLPGPGNYYIRSTTKMAHDNDYVFVNITEDTYGDLFVWDRETIAKYEADENVGKVVRIIGDLAIAFTVTGRASKLVAVALAVVDSTGIIEDQYKNETEIMTTPREGWSWQYRFVPTQSGYDIYLMVYDQYGYLDSDNKVGSVSLTEQ